MLSYKDEVLVFMGYKRFVSSKRYSFIHAALIKQG